MKKILIVLILVLAIGGLYVWVKRQELTPPINEVTFACDDGKVIQARVEVRPTALGKAELKLNDRSQTYLLNQTRSASGARYANRDESFVFWNKGDTAFIQENGTTTFNNCVIDPTASWLTYQSDKFGYSVKYPKGWTVDEGTWSGNNPGDHVMIMKQDVKPGEPGDFTLGVVVGGNAPAWVSKPDFSEIKSLVDSTINGLPAKSAEFRGGGQSGPHTDIFLTHNGVNYVLELLYNEPRDGVVDQMVSTFKFVTVGSTTVKR